MNNLTIVEPKQELPTQLDIAKQALKAATHNWERVQIRDTAYAIAAAAAILQRKDIQVQAANLVQAAERAIAKASPPQQGKTHRQRELRYSQSRSSTGCAFH